MTSHQNITSQEPTSCSAGIHGVAIVGIACRFPGSENVEEFWESLKRGENHVTEIPKERWSQTAYYDPETDRPGTTYTNKAALLDRVHDWDNTLFGINEYEAERMDPQHKLALEVTYRALENAGIPPSKMKGTNTAVYMGQMNDDYAKLMSVDPCCADNYTATGTAASILANRISYTFDLHGPSATIDTACSSSLFAVHLGAQSIVTGDSNLALCGGVNIILSPTPPIALAKARMASRKGQSHAFSNDADGYTRGEGCGVVILKNAEQARKDNNRIWGYVTTGSNSDGRASIPITSPSFEMQKSLIEATVRKSGLEPHQVQYVEMHGTGTPVGDPVEASTVGQAIGMARKQNSLPPLMIGSVKTNIGHQESAAGVAGLIKVLLMMEHSYHVPSLFSNIPNNSINFEGLHLSISQETQLNPYMENQERVASVNSFGFGGTNVHAVVTKYDVNMDNRYERDSLPFQIVCFSGKTEKSVRLSLRDVINAIEKNQVSNVEDIAVTASNYRDQYTYRVGAICQTGSVQKLKETLELHEKGTVAKVKNANIEVNTVFVFCGMGTHWQNMGLEFYETVPVFQKTLDKIDDWFYPLSNFKIVDCLRGLMDVSNPKYGQPSIFAIEIGIVEMLKCFGVTPDVIVGHSVGEIAAANASNHLSLESCVKLIFERSNLLNKVKGGGMLVIGNVPTHEIEQCILENNYESKISIAAYNSFDSCTVSGEVECLHQLEEILKDHYKSKSDGGSLFLHTLQVDVAYHSKFMDPIIEELEKNLQGHLKFPEGSEKEIKHVSTVTGDLTSSDTFTEKTYWSKNVRETVQFEKAFTKALDMKKHNVVIEIGPRAALSKYIKTIGKNHHLSHFSTMLPNKCNDQFFPTVAKIYEAGRNLKHRDTQMSVSTGLPRYGLDKNTLFNCSEKVADFLSGEETNIFKHPFASKQSSNGNMATISLIEKKVTPFVFDHIVDNNVIVPGATYIEMAAATCFMFFPDMFNRGQKLLMQIDFRAPCVLAGERKKQTLKTAFFEPERSSNANKAWEFDVTTDGILHAQGKLKVEHLSEKSRLSESLHNIQSRCQEGFSAEDLYSKLRNLKFAHGPLLQCVESGWKNAMELIAHIKIPDDAQANYLLHPVLLDGLLQLCVMFPQSEEMSKRGQIIPSGVEEIKMLSIPDRESIVYLTICEKNNTEMEFNGAIMNKSGEICVNFKSIRFAVVGSDKNTNPIDVIYCLKWKNVKINNKTEHQKIKCVLFSNFAESDEIQLLDKGVAQHIVKLNHQDDMTDEDYFVKNLPDMSSFTDILFGFGCCLDVDDDIDGCSLNDTIARICLFLLQLVKFVQKNFPQINVSVLTRGVHSVMADDVQIRHGIDGLVGYSLWGMMRTTVMENAFQHYRTIDIDSVNPESMKSLITVLSLVDFGVDVAITHNGVKGFCFEKMSANGEMPPRKMLVPSDFAVVVSAKGIDEVNDTYQEITTLTLKTDSTVTFEMMYVPRPGVISEIYGKEYQSGETMMSLGAKGYYKNEAVHCISILKTCNKGDVSEKFFIPVSLLPSTAPTSAIWFLAWTFCQEVEMSENKYFQLLSNASFEVLSKAVSHVSSLMKYKMFNEENKRNVFILASNLRDVIVLLHNIEFHHICSISVLTWSRDSAREIKVYLDKIFGKDINRVIFITADIFQNPSTLESKIDMFKRWLKAVKLGKHKECIENVDNLLKQKAFCAENLEINSEVGEMMLKFTESKRDDVRCAVSEDCLYKRQSGYMIFGGSKGLGWETACHFAKKGVKKIGIISRNGLNTENKQWASESESKFGCKFVDIKADVTILDDVKRAIDEFQNCEPKCQLKGIFFGTVVLDDATIPNMSFEKMNRVLKPKVAAVWNIHKITMSYDLEFFVCHSSIASMFGNPGQTNYSAANAFLDAYACYRKKKHGVGQSICWGALDLGVLQNQADKQKILSNLGMLTLRREEILKCLGHCLLFDPTLVCMAKINWPTLVKQMRYTDKRNAMETLMWRKGHFITSPSSLNDDNQKMNKGFLTVLLQRVLMIDEENIHSKAKLEDLGGDSHNLNIIYVSIVKEYGEVPHLSRVGISTMTIEEIQKHITEINAGTQTENMLEDPEEESVTQNEVQESNTNQITEVVEVKSQETTTASPLENSNESEIGLEVEEKLKSPYWFVKWIQGRTNWFLQKPSW